MSAEPAIKCEVEDVSFTSRPEKMSPEPPSLTPVTNIFDYEQPTLSPQLPSQRPEELKPEEVKKEDTEPEEEEEDEEEDPINAAIQRVIAQSSIDEDSDDMDNWASACNKIVVEPPEVLQTGFGFNETKNDVMVNKKVSLKRKSVGKRVVLSKEFVMDDSSTDCESDSSEERLVIANEDESTCDSSASPKLSAISSSEDKKIRSPTVEVIVSRGEDKTPAASEISLPKVSLGPIYD